MSQHKPPVVVFTITPGRTGTAYLAELLRRNLPGANVYHERVSFKSIGLDSPDASHFMRFNSEGNTEHVKEYWRQKAARVREEADGYYAESSHFNARAGLVENIELFTEFGEVRLIALSRDRVDLAWSLFNRFDFANNGFTWLFALDPGYPNTIIPSKEYVKHGMAGSALWYGDEMRARAAYYQRLTEEIPGVSFFSSTTNDIVHSDGARELLGFVANQKMDEEIDVPGRRNETKSWNFPETEKSKIADTAKHFSEDPEILGQRFFESGRRLCSPRKPQFQVQVRRRSPVKADLQTNSGQARTAKNRNGILEQYVKSLAQSPDDNDLRSLSVIK